MSTCRCSRTRRSIRQRDERAEELAQILLHTTRDLTVLVRIGAYGDWHALGVTVEGGVCHVQTVQLRAVLLPA